jgi:hypothetical protein
MNISARHAGDLFERLQDTTQQQMALGRPKQPGWCYAQAELPQLPRDCPDWLAAVLRALVRSGTGAGGGAEEPRISATAAIGESQAVNAPPN